MKHPRLILGTIAAIAWLTGSAPARPAIDHVRLLTSDPEDDQTPAFTPDGKWMVFVSNRSGNRELHSRRVDRELVDIPKALAPSLADDYEPVFSPDGRWLAWISEREDVFGDVWVMRFPGGDPVHLARRGARDTRIAWTGDKNDLRVVWQSEDEAGNPVQCAARAGDWKVETLATAPELPASDLRLLWEDDTNGDGEASQASGDDPAVWRHDKSSGQWRQITPAIPGLNSVQLHEGRLVISANFRGNLDVAEVVEPFAVETIATPDEALAAARAAWREHPEDPFGAAALARRAYLLDSGVRAGQDGLFLMIDILRAAGRPEQALRAATFARFATAAPDDVEAELRLRVVLLKFEVAERKGLEPDAMEELRAALRAELARILGAEPLPSITRAHAGLGLAAFEARELHRDEAMSALRAVEDLPSLPADLAGRARLARARLLRDALPGEATSILRGLAAGSGDAELEEDAAVELANLAIEGKGTLDEKVLGLREEASNSADSPAIGAYFLLREGELFAAAARTTDARAAFERASAMIDRAPRSAARASLRLAELQVSQREFREAVRTYEKAADQLRELAFPGADQLRRRAREGFVREYLARGEEELHLNDPHMAQATFRALLDQEPELVEAWRGLLESQYRAKQLSDSQIAQYRSAATRKKDSAVAWYVYGLALTYPDPSSRKAVDAISRAIALDAAVPYFHQTLGFVYEAKARETNSQGDRATALSEYQRAISLLDAARRPADYARLLVNAGNAAGSLGSNARAADYYQRRLDQAVPFDDPRTEFLMARNHGIVLFRASRARDAVVRLRDARTLLPELVSRKLVTDIQSRELETELLDREALALMDANAVEEAAAVFAQVAERNEPNSLNRVRALRNRGFTLHRLSQRSEGAAKEKARRAAEESLREALRLVQSRDLVEPRAAKDNSRLFGMDFAFSSDSMGGAVQSFSREEEERLLRAGIARLGLESGDSLRAIAELQERLKDNPRTTDGNRAYFMTARVITQDQLASEQIRTGSPRDAAKTLLESLKSTRFDVKGIAQVNANGLSRILARLAELALATETVPFAADDLRASWIGADITAAEPLQALDACIDNALALRTEGAGVYVLARPSFRARLLLCRALLAELASLDGASGAEIDAARATALAEQVINESGSAEADAEAKRLGVLAHGVALRVSVRLGAPDVAVQWRDRGVRYARRAGYPELAWWVRAQEAIDGTPPQRAKAALEALNELEAVPPGLASADVPVELLALCERLVVDDAASRQDWTAVLSASERFAAARLRLALENAAPPENATNAADAQWMREALVLRADYRRAAQRVRELPFTVEQGLAAGALERSRVRWAKHLESGRKSLLPSALLFDPHATTVENPAVALSEGVASPLPVVFVLRSLAGDIAWTSEGAKPLAPGADWSDLSAAPALWLVMGDVPEAMKLDGSVVRVATFESTLLAMGEFRLELGTPPVEWPATTGAPDPAPKVPVLESTDQLQFTSPVLARGRDPFAWIVDGTTLPLGDVFGALPPLSGIDAQIVQPPATSERTAELRREILATLAAWSGSARATVDDRAYVGAVFAAKDMPAEADAQLAASVGSLRDAIETRRDSAAALPAARRVYFLRRALGRPAEEIAEAGLLLAQVQGELSQHAAATRTAAEVVELRRAGGDKASLAAALRLHASYAADALEFDAALASVSECSALYSELGDDAARLDMEGRAGVVLENAGRYSGALEKFKLVRAAAEKGGDAVLQAEQLRRIGRIHLLRLSDYSRAEEAFERAMKIAEAAGARDLVILSALDLARVDERLGRYESALNVAALMETKATEADAPLLRIDALLLRAFVLWARADYFEAFKAQREAQHLAEELNDAPFLIIAHNTSGLISWALNDTESALRSSDRALALAMDSGFPGEVATTYNNRALVYRSTGEFDKALDDLGNALRIDRAQHNAWGEAYAQRNIGLTLLMRGDAAAALDPLGQATDIARTIGDRTNRTKAVVATGDALRTLGRNDEARKSYDEALTEARAIPLPEVEWRALYGLALLSEAGGDKNGARTSLADAIAVVEKLRARIKIEEFQDGFLLDKQKLYDDMVRLQLDAGATIGAFNYSERSRSRQFIDLLGNAHVELAQDQDAESLARERTLRAAVESMEKRAGASSASDRPAIHVQLDDARRAYTDFMIELRARNPQLSGFVEVQTADVPAIQSLLEPDTRLLEYHVLDNELAIWVIGPQSMQSVRVPVGRKELSERIASYRRRLQDFARVDEEGAILSQWLIEPVVPLLDGAKRLAIAPHRELHLMPFASLRIGGEYAIDRFALFHTPSASVLRYSFARRTSEARNNRVLAVGNPDLGNDALALPFAEKEARRIAWTFPEAKILTGGEATESWVSENIGNYGIIHIATHGEFDPNAPLMSAILLAKDGENDGQLTASEVFGLSLNADLVALSACQTGLGRLSNGDDVVGLNRSFVYAGTRQILSTLWRVDDVSTAVMIKHFYRNIATEDRAEALRQAQIETRRRYPHPAHWSGMFLSGDWR